MNNIPLNLDQLKLRSTGATTLNDAGFDRFTKELELSKKIEKYHREQPYTHLNRTHSKETFYMREIVAGIKNKADKLRDKLSKE